MALRSSFHTPRFALWKAARIGVGRSFRNANRMRLSWGRGSRYDLGAGRTPVLLRVTARFHWAVVGGAILECLTFPAFGAHNVRLNGRVDPVRRAEPPLILAESNQAQENRQSYRRGSKAERPAHFGPRTECCLQVGNRSCRC